MEPFKFPDSLLPSLLDAVWQALKIFLSVWYIWGPLFLLKLLPGLYDRWRFQRAGMPEIDRMTGLEFEKYLEVLFRQLGYRVERTPYIGDQGGDLVLAKDGERILVQAKRYKKAVGNKAVQEAAAARPHYTCDRAMVVSNQEFTRAARELARSNQVDLWERDKLTKVVLSLGAAPAAEPTAQPAPQPTPAVRVPSSAPACNRCGQTMVVRESARGKFWGCSSFPRCRNTLPLGGEIGS